MVVQLIPFVINLILVLKEQFVKCTALIKNPTQILKLLALLKVLLYLCSKQLRVYKIL